MDLWREVEDSTALFVSNRHLNDVVALCAAALEMQTFGREYAAQFIANAKALAKALADSRLPVAAEERGFTESHQAWVMMDREESFSACKNLEQARILVNRTRLPTVLGSAGLRLDVAEVTRLGFRELAVLEIAALVSGVILRSTSRDSTRSAVEALRKRNRALSYCFPAEQGVSRPSMTLS